MLFKITFLNQFLIQNMHSWCKVDKLPKKGQKSLNFVKLQRGLSIWLVYPSNINKAKGKKKNGKNKLVKFLWHILGKKAIKSNIKTKKSLDVESPEYFQCKKIHKDEWLEDYQASSITQFTKPVKIYLQMFKSFYISLIAVMF